MNEHRDKRHPVGVSHPPTHRRSCLAPWLAAGCMLLASPAWARLEILLHELTASTSITYSDPFGTNTSVAQTEYETSLAPFVSYVDGKGRPGDGVAESFTDRPGIAQGRQLYAASVQKSTSNAVAAQTTYTGGTSVALSAITRWRVTANNPGTTPEPVDLSFFISGGGLDAWCANCFAGGLVMSTTLIDRLGAVVNAHRALCSGTSGRPNRINCAFQQVRTGERPCTPLSFR